MKITHNNITIEEDSGFSYEKIRKTKKKDAYQASVKKKIKHKRVRFEDVESFTGK
jgi:hypothetical protein